MKKGTQKKKGTRFEKMNTERAKKIGVTAFIGFGEPFLAPEKGKRSREFEEIEEALLEMYGSERWPFKQGSGIYECEAWYDEMKRQWEIVPVKFEARMKEGG